MSNEIQNSFFSRLGDWVPPGKRPPRPTEVEANAKPPLHQPEIPELAEDNLPYFESMADFYNSPPPLKDELIFGCLRQGHKMLLSGPSKAGKSLALMALTIAIAEGRSWLGMPCRQGRVLYINLELDRASCWHRFRDICQAMGVANPQTRNVDVWHLRGHSLPLDELAPKLIARAQAEDGEPYRAIIIDPIYKIITGDENSAEEMAAFCNQFDRLCTELGTAVIYCHHHSKGAQGAKKAQDRASGSGVFARDPDAILDMIELELTDEARLYLQGRSAFAETLRQLDQRLPAWRDAVPAEEHDSPAALLDVARTHLPGEEYRAMQSAIAQASADAALVTAWRIEPTLREFNRFHPINVWLDYPLHQVDDAGVLAGLSAGEASSWRKSGKPRPAAKADAATRFAASVDAANRGEPPTLRELAAYLGVSERTCRDHIKRYGYKLDSRTKLIVRDGLATLAG